ncbi:MAG: hypothetical protein NUW01_00350, partial [Gemmatimonadaceae bacterium]|nr:hypothetical protein [Gemmatimonadaceae bacterium]
RLMILTAALPIALGCAPQPMPRTAIAPSDEPMEVRLFLTGTGALNFYVSEPAYVALFEVRPDRASLLFPNYEEETQIARAGVNVVRLSGARRAYSPPVASYSGFRPFQPRYFYMIASKSPLRLDGIRLSMTKQSQPFSTTGLSGMVSYLAASAASGMPDKEWSAHLYAIWPEPSFAACAWNGTTGGQIDTRALAWRFGSGCR